MLHTNHGIGGYLQSSRRIVEALCSLGKNSNIIAALECMEGLPSVTCEEREAGILKKAASLRLHTPLSKVYTRLFSHVTFYFSHTDICFISHTMR
jgi:hypothetical protein